MGAVPAGRRRPVGLTSAGRWAVSGRSGNAGAFHRRPWPSPAVPTVGVFAVDRPALVLGSTQPVSVVDSRIAAATGVEVVRRHSGGGAVLLRPGAVVWVDVLVPAGDPRWEPDVNRAFLWLGRAWAAAVGDLGVQGAAVHEGALVRTRWSELVCFAGVGPGEVTVAGRKVVGMSSRRRREGALLQCAALLEWDAAATADLLSVPAEEVSPMAVGLPVAGEALVGALLTRLADC